MRQELENQADRHRPNRDPHDSDRFLYLMPPFQDGGATHQFTFKVNDTQATGWLFAEEVTDTRTP